MKFVFTFLILVAVPFVLVGMLLTVVVPLIIQHFVTPPTSDAVVYPYLTSWEEAA